MANAETAEKALNEMYNHIMAGISAGTAALDGKVGTAVSVKMGGVDIIKDQLTHPGDNRYQAIGRLVGDSIGVIASISVGGKITVAKGSGDNDNLSKTALCFPKE